MPLSNDILVENDPYIMALRRQGNTTLNAYRRADGTVYYSGQPLPSTPVGEQPLPSDRTTLPVDDMVDFLPDIDFEKNQRYSVEDEDQNEDGNVGMQSYPSISAWLQNMRTSYAPGIKQFGEDLKKMPGSFVEAAKTIPSAISNFSKTILGRDKNYNIADEPEFNEERYKAEAKARHDPQAERELLAKHEDRPGQYDPEIDYAEGGTIQRTPMEMPQPSNPGMADDLQRNLSEGEFVIPADVVKYYGTKFFHSLIEKAANPQKGLLAKNS